MVDWIPWIVSGTKKSLGKHTGGNTPGETTRTKQQCENRGVGGLTADFARGNQLRSSKEKNGTAKRKGEGRKKDKGCLVGGFKYFLFSSLLGGMIQFD